MICAVTWVTGVISNVHAQHSRLFSQYLTNGMAINPAYCGSRDALSMGLSFRKQWLGFKGAPMNQALYAHMPFKDARNNIGLTLFHDQIGVSNFAAAYFSYAFRFDFKDRGRLALGLQGGVSLMQNDFMNLYLRDGDAADPNFTGADRIVVTPRTGFGIYYDHRKWFVGVSVPQILQISEKGIGPASRFDFDYYFMTAGYAWEVNPEFTIRPSVKIRYIKNSPFQFDLSTYFILKENLWLGVSYRHMNAVIALFEYQISPQFRIGYAFDQSITKMWRQNYGSHELFLRYELKYGVKAENTRYF